MHENEELKMFKGASDKASEQKQASKEGENNQIQVARTDEELSQGVPKPVLQPTDNMIIAKWKIKSAFYCMAFTSVLCVAAIMINPADQVLRVVLAIWATTGAVCGVLLRGSYSK
jgi:hypothetical protein